MIVLADSVGANVHEVGEHNSVIIFTEVQLNDFINQVSILTLKGKNELY